MRADHAHGGERLGVAAAGVRPARCARRPLRSPRAGARVNTSVRMVSADQNDRADQRGQPDQRVEDEADRQIKRDPGQIEQRDRAQAAEDKSGWRRDRAAADCRRRGCRRAAAAAPGVVDAAAQAPHRARRRCAPGCGREWRRAGQAPRTGRRPARQARPASASTARQHAVIDLEHEHGAGQHQDVAHAADQRGAEKGAAASGKRGREFGARLEMSAAWRFRRHQPRPCGRGGTRNRQPPMYLR